MCSVLRSRFGITQRAAARLPTLQRVLASLPIVWLGDCSYSIYLVHAVVIEIVWRAGVAAVTTDPLLRLVLELTFVVIGSVLVARAFFVACERPFLRRRSGRPACRASDLTPRPLETVATARVPA